MRRLNFLNMFGQSENIGVNYDLGNSASLGFEPTAEVSTLNKKIINVHRSMNFIINGSSDFINATISVLKVLSNMINLIKFILLFNYHNINLHLFNLRFILFANL